MSCWKQLMSRISRPRRSSFYLESKRSSTLDGLKFGRRVQVATRNETTAKTDDLREVEMDAGVRIESRTSQFKAILSRKNPDLSNMFTTPSSFK
jgi:hypothetical protein